MPFVSAVGGGQGQRSIVCRLCHTEAAEPGYPAVAASAGKTVKLVNISCYPSIVQPMLCVSNGKVGADLFAHMIGSVNSCKNFFSGDAGTSIGKELSLIHI